MWPLSRRRQKNRHKSFHDVANIQCHSCHSDSTDINDTLADDGIDDDNEVIHSLDII